MMPAKLLSIDEACHLLGCSRWKFYRLEAEEGLPVMRWGSKVRLHPDALDEWMRRQNAILMEPSTSPPPVELRAKQ